MQQCTTYRHTCTWDAGVAEITGRTNVKTSVAKTRKTKYESMISKAHHLDDPITEEEEGLTFLISSKYRPISWKFLTLASSFCKQPPFNVHHATSYCTTTLFLLPAVLMISPGVVGTTSWFVCTTWWSRTSYSLPWCLPNFLNCLPSAARFGGQCTVVCLDIVGEPQKLIEKYNSHAHHSSDRHERYLWFLYS